jgi:hypothetical protein
LLEGDRNYNTYNRAQSPNEITYDRTSTSANDRLTSVSSTRIEQVGRVDVTPSQTRTPVPTLDTSNLDFEIIECILQRRDPTSSLGLSLANQTNNINNSLSKTSTVSFRDDQQQQLMGKSRKLQVNLYIILLA